MRVKEIMTQSAVYCGAESRDPVAGTVYYMMLGVFAVMPLLLERKQN